MGLIEMLLVLLLIILIAQLVLSFIPGLDRTIVGIIILLIVLIYFFGGFGRGRFWRSDSGETQGNLQYAASATPGE